jgi:hypothetical protein
MDLRALLTVLPELTKAPKLPPALQPHTTAAITDVISNGCAAEFQLFSIGVRQASREEKPRPLQGGQCITVDWLLGLRDRDCL